MPIRILVVAAVLFCAATTLSMGAPDADAVYNGVSADWDANSQLVQLYEGHVAPDRFNCGGTLLDDVWVLTAAHCATTMDNTYGCEQALDLRYLSSLSVGCFVPAERAMALYMGTTAKRPSDIRARIAPGEEREVAQVIVYPAFTTVLEAQSPSWQALPCAWTCARVGGVAWLSGDIALLRLRTPAPAGTAHSQLPSDSSLISAARKVKALGWGDTDPGTTQTLSTTDLKVTRDNALELTSPPTLPGCDPDGSPYASQVPAAMVLCVQSPATIGGTGGGDSGGPLYAPDADGSPRQIGVTSFGPTTEYPTAADPEAYASVPKMVKWIRSKTGLSGDVQTGSDNVATSLVIDNSGSMSSNDPDLRRRDAAKSYVSTGLDGDQIGAVGFESSATTIAGMTRLPAGRPALLSALDSGIHAGGGTDIGSGLSAACAMLDDGSLAAKRAAILLTDGDGGYSNESSCFSSHGWKVFTIGLGSGVNEALLQQIADDTGGTYQPVPDAASLQCEFQKIRATVAGAAQSPCLSDLVQAGQTVVHLVAVAARLAQVAFSSVWPGSDVQMTLVSPSGRRIERATSDWDVTHEHGPTSESYVVKVPEPGEWKVELYGADVATGGEPVSFGANPIPFDNELPTLSPTATPTSGNAPRTVAFDAHAADADGTVDGVTWDFGDGTAGSGETTTHTYLAGGTYTATATAIDDQGESASQQAPPIVVAGAPPTAAFTATVQGAGIALDASQSESPGATLKRYGWDFDGDGDLDLESTAASASWAYPAPGEYAITLTIESSTGASDATTRTVSVPAGVPVCPAEQSGTPPDCHVLVSDCPPGQTGTPPNCTALVRGRLRTLRLSASTTPRRDTTSPFTFTTRGRMVPPPYCANLAATGCVLRPARRCSGTVTVRIRKGTATVSKRRVALRSDCTYRSRVSLPSRAGGTLRVSVRFDGNVALLPRSARTATVRASAVVRSSARSR